MSNDAMVSRLVKQRFVPQFEKGLETVQRHKSQPVHVIIGAYRSDLPGRRVRSIHVERWNRSPSASRLTEGFVIRDRYRGCDFPWAFGPTHGNERAFLRPIDSKWVNARLSTASAIGCLRHLRPRDGLSRSIGADTSSTLEHL